MIVNRSCDVNEFCLDIACVVLRSGKEKADGPFPEADGSDSVPGNVRKSDEWANRSGNPVHRGGSLDFRRRVRLFWTIMFHFGG